MAKLLVVDNDEGLVGFLRRLFTEHGYAVASCASGTAVLDRLASESFDAILMDSHLPGLNGLDTLAEIKRAQVKTPVILMSAFGATDTAIQAMKLGAYDYLLKPFDTEELKRIVADAVEVNRLMKEVVSLPHSRTPHREVPSPSPDTQIVGSNRKMQEVFKLIGQVAAKDVTVLITGESGTGKELVARAIHQHSLRAEKQFMAVNCAAIPEPLFESELFGYERGAFTGAERTYVGKFERCHQGTLFFDEIGDMSLATQAKVLRVLQEGEFERLGGSKPIRVNARILAATNKDLEKEVRQGHFREDLYYRLRIISIHLPPLRARLDDVPALVDYFVGRFASDYGSSVRYVSDEAVRKLQSHAWPGNVRQLENCLRRAVLVCKGDVLLPEHIALETEPTPPGPPSDQQPLHLEHRIDALVREVFASGGRDARASLIDRVERSLIARALELCSHNQVRTARLLGISRNTLRHRIRKYQLEPPGPSPPR